MPYSTLRTLGFSPNEAKIYEALLTYGGSAVSTISLRANVHRRNAYDAVQRLLEKGLVFEAHGGGDVTYEAVEPSKLLEFVREKEEALEQALPLMQKLYHTTRAPELTYIYKGVEGVKNYMRLALKAGKDMYTLGAEGAWLDPRIAGYTKAFMAEAKKKKMKIHAILEDDAHMVPGAPELLADSYKFLPHKYDTHATMDIFGDFVVTYTGTQPGKLSDNVTIFVMFSPALAHSYRIWWQALWDLLPAEKAKKRRVAKAKGKR